jgi:hypothetical protein
VFFRGRSAEEQISAESENKLLTIIPYSRKRNHTVLFLISKQQLNLPDQSERRGMWLPGCGPLASRMRLSGMPVHRYSKNKWGITSETMKK